MVDRLSRVDRLSKAVSRHCHDLFRCPAEVLDAVFQVVFLVDNEQVEHDLLADNIQVVCCPLADNKSMEESDQVDKSVGSVFEVVWGIAAPVVAMKAVRVVLAAL